MRRRPLNPEIQRELELAAAKTAPAGAMVVASVTEWGIQEWMYAGTLAYVIAQLLYLIWKWRREARKPE